jgi:hypothetical protein
LKKRQKNNYYDVFVLNFFFFIYGFLAMEFSDFEIKIVEKYDFTIYFGNLAFGSSDLYKDNKKSTTGKVLTASELYPLLTLL